MQCYDAYRSHHVKQFMRRCDWQLFGPGCCVGCVWRGHVYGQVMARLAQLLARLMHRLEEVIARILWHRIEQFQHLAVREILTGELLRGRAVRE